MEHLVQAAILHTPVPNQLGVGGAQVDLLIGQFEEGGVLVRTDAVGAELVEGWRFLLGASREARKRLQRGEDRSSHSDCEQRTISCSPGQQIMFLHEAVVQFDVKL